MLSVWIWEIISFQKKELLHSHSLDIKAGSPEQGWPRSSIRGWQAANFSAPHSCPAAAENLSLFLLWAFFCTCTAPARMLGLAAELWCLHEQGWELRWGWGPENAEPGFPPLSLPLQPLHRAGTRSAAVMKHIWEWVCSTVKWWQPWPALEASWLSAKLVNQGMLNCQIHQTSKEMKLFPWSSFCSLATETFHQSFPLKSQAVRCSGIPSSSSPEPSRALSPLQCKPKCLKIIVKNPLQTQ